MKTIDQAYLRNQRQDLKISSTPFSFLNLIFSTLGIGFIFSIFLIPLAFAEVYIPSHEYLGYFDSEGIYTVVGNIKNENRDTIIPTITVSIEDGNETFSKTIKHVAIASDKEIPFKIKFPEVSGNSPILIPAKISFEVSKTKNVPLEILYDNTLVKHQDGHLTGRIQNTGEETIYFPKIFAVVHGYERVLDTVQNIEFIEKIEPGEIVEFSMYPDPSITEEVFYYSCFAPVDTTVVPITTKKHDGEFDFRYDSGAWYYDAKFDEEGTTLTIRGYNSYPLETYANFEFPPISGNEKFHVTINGEPIDFIQSIDEMGFWHIAYGVGPTTQDVVTISGFEKGLPPELPKIPQWIRLSADWWVTDRISDSEFLEGIDFLFEKQIVSVPSKEVITPTNWEIPFWYKTTVGWWSEEKISDDDFLYAIENLVAREIIII